MKSEVHVCNLALVYAGVRLRISSLNDKSAEAQQCALLYEHCVSIVLERSDWAFARRNITGQVLPITPPLPWQKVVKYPTDCVKLRRIDEWADVIATAPVSTTFRRDIPFLVALHPTDPSRVIYTPTDNVRLVYTALVTQASVWPNLFTEAVARRLAIDLGLGLDGPDEAKARAAELKYESALSIAITADSVEDNAGESPPSEFTLARLDD